MKKVPLDFRNILALINCIGGYGVLILLFFKKVPKENETMINIAVGAIIVSSANNILNWYFGSSKTQTPSGAIQNVVTGDATLTQTTKTTPETPAETPAEKESTTA